MNNNENELRESQLAAIGKILAGLSHDLKNHISIINESAGLMGDILEMDPSFPVETRDRIKKSIKAIEDRVQLTNQMTKHLNRYAHRMDAAEMLFTVNDALEEELFFLERLSRRQQHILKIFLNCDQLVNGNPSLLQFAFFCIFVKSIESIGKGSTITISASCEHDRACVAVESIGEMISTEPLNTAEAFSPALSIALQKLDGHLIMPPSEQQKVTLSFPLR